MHSPALADDEAAPYTGRPAFAALHYVRYRWLLSSNLLFFFAMNGQFAVRSVLAYKLTGSAVALGLVNLFVSVPMVLFAPLGGALADRLDRKLIIMFGQIGITAIESTVLILYATGHLEFWHLLIGVSLQGAMFPCIMPARQALVASIVGRTALPNAMALQMSAVNAARIAGPALGAFMIFAVGISGAYLVSIGFYVGAFVLILAIGAVPQLARAPSTVFGDIVEGFSFIWRQRPVRALMLFGLLPIILGLPFQTLLVIFAEDVWHVGTNGFGALQAFAGLGGLIGSVTLAFRGQVRRPRRIMFGTLAAFGCTLLLFALSPWFLLALPLVLIADACASTFQTTNNTIMQLLIPDHVRGRVMSVMMMSFGLQPLGAVPVSAAAQAFGAPAAISGSAILLLIATFAAYVLSRPLRDIDAISDGATAAPAALLPARRAQPVATPAGGS